MDIKKEFGEQNCVITLTDGAHGDSQNLNDKLYVRTLKEENKVLGEKSISEIVNYVKSNFEEDINKEGILSSINSIMQKNYMISVNGIDFLPNEPYNNNKPANQAYINDEKFFDQEIDENDEPFLTCDITVRNKPGKTVLGGI